MPQDLILSDFSAGWCPSDDPINGRKNGLLKMDSLELDQNGAIRLSGGSALLFTYGTDAHTIYAKFLKDAQYRYAALTDGTVYRNSTSIATGASATRAGFAAAFDYVICCSGGKRIKDDGTTITNLGRAVPTAPTSSLNGAGILIGDYTYVQINVLKNGAYIAKSPPSTETVAVTATSNKIQVDPSTPAGGENEVWVFRRGGDLDQYYRVYRQVASLGTAFDDNVSDQDALDEGITLDLNALSVTSTDLPDDILEVVGPVNGRMIYFTKNAINFSELNSPDSYHPTQSKFYAGGATGAEIFLFARKIDDNTVIVATTNDYYLLTGTFITQPDGTLDILFRALGVDHPSISIDGAIFNRSVIAMAANGWQITGADGQQIPLNDDRTDRIYRGESLQGYGGVPIYILPQYRYSCAVSRDKLYVRVPQIVGGNPATTFTYRMEVYDFKRKYWRPLPEYNPLMLYGQEDDSILGFFGTSHTLRSIDDQFTKLNNGSNQTISLKTPILDCGKPQTRKDFYNFRCKFLTNGDTLTLDIYTNNGSILSYSTNIIGVGFDDLTINIYALVGTTENIQIHIHGALSDFLLTNLKVEYDYRPDKVAALILIPKTGPNKTRVRVWSFKIDPLGVDITCTPYLDGVAQDPIIFGAVDYEKTFFVQFTEDQFAVDYKFKLSTVFSMEFYEMGNPEIVQVLPIAKRFDQLGPIELFRYGRIKLLELRAITFGGTTIPYVLYLDDTQLDSGNLSFVSAKESVATINIPKNIEGSILRVELGPTEFDFHRIYGRAQIQKSGRDTEIEWVAIDNMVGQNA